MRLTALLMLIVIPGPTAAQPPDVPPPESVPGGEKDAIPDAELLTALIAGMADEDLTVRQNLAFAAAELGPAAVGPLTAALRDADPGRRAAAAYALGQIGGAAEPALPALVAALGDETADVRRQASYAVGRILAQRKRSEPPLTPNGDAR